MKSPELSRRALLRHLGLGAGMLPLLNVSAANAAGVSTGPKRLLIVQQTGGCVLKDVFSTAGGSLANQKLPQTLSPLEPHKNDIITIANIRMSNFLDPGNYGAGHENYASSFTGCTGYVLKRSDGDRMNGGGPTPDQVIATELAKTVKLPFKSIAMATQVDDTESLSFLRRCFWSGPNQDVTPEHDPNKLAAALFGKAPTSAGGGPTADGAEAKAKAQLLDFVGRDLEGFSKRVGTEDRMKIQQHLQAYRDLQQQLANAAPAPAAGSACKAPTSSAGLNTHDLLKYKAVMDAQFDLVTAAFACDATRVATIQLSNGSGTKVVFPDLPSIGTTNSVFKDTKDLGLRNYHDVQHAAGPDSRDKITVDRWYMAQFAALITRLKQIPEGNGKSVFDNTVILWGNHMGDGGAHSSTQLPWILAGSCGGYFKTGQNIKGGTVHTNGVLVALCNAMGVPRSFFNDAKYGGELAGLRA